MWNWWRKIQAVDLSEWLRWFDPLTYMSAEEYAALWRWIFENLFLGDLARVSAVACLCLALWYGAIKQRWGLGLIFYLLTHVFAYGNIVRHL
ncbi:MAG: hypothetical protein D6690_05200 [Nitrospirae bacterium]|nr:MAG: hypothetical protein D6690_05200 [Nitrospirota bacterium]